MPRYFISMNVLIGSQLAMGKTFVQTIDDNDKKGIILYNKNQNTYSYWKKIRKPIDRYGWIVERDECPDYWKKVILEEPEDGGSTPEEKA